MNWRAFFQGMGSIFDLFPTVESKPLRPYKHQSVEEALRADWEAVGMDMRRAMATVDAELTDEQRARFGDAEPIEERAQ